MAKTAAEPPKRGRGLILLWTAASAAVAAYLMRGALEKSNVAPQDLGTELGICEKGSACFPELARANRSLDELWPDDSTDLRHRRVHNEAQRIKYNVEQPARVPKFTKEGFKVTRVPEATFAALAAFYAANKDASEVEQWPEDNTYVNHWAQPTYMAHMPYALRQRVLNDLRPIMEKWSGEELEATSCYGVRSYKRGSILAVHVDRVSTHVISGIINVQQEVDEDWLLYAKDHNRTIHQITMVPGDLLLYESASVIHGRPTEFQGDNFANLFVHYKPKLNWDVRAEQFHINADVVAEVDE